ncbi:AzlD domain-containing protein [Tropicimonas sp. S265A]|uniref:AzlD domain-containing protein n=1 Tax=Tropicimonas sp. S265A TaxID=3415134 RepID=UPI003C7DC715
MIELSAPTIWMIIVFLGIGTLGLRYSFLGALGGRDLPEWVLRHLRYTAVGVLPALIAPLVVWPEATNGAIDPARLAAAAVTLAVGVWSKNALLSILCGAVTLFGALALLG